MVQAWLEEGETRGREQQILEMARNMLAIGMTVEQTATVIGLSVQQIQALSAD